MKIFFTLILFTLLGCTSHSQIENKIASKSDSNELYQIEDSIEKSFNEGEYFMTSFIRLNKNDFAFIYIEDEYVKDNIKDEKIKELFINTKSLTKENREDFYSKMVSNLPKEDLEIHKIVWNLDEVKTQGKNQDGGLYTLATWIVNKPTKDDPNYFVEVRRNYYDRFGICNEIGFIKINSITNEIVVLDIHSGEYLPIEEWRNRIED